MTRCLTCDTELAVHDDLYHDISVMAGRPIVKLSDLYNNELENILRALINFKHNITANTLRVTDYGVFPDGRGVDLDEDLPHDSHYPSD
jgi:hypothetical protein